MDQHWLTVVIALLIVGIIVDGIRRMRKARRDSIKMALRPTKKQSETHEDDAKAQYGSEFPNGGARASKRKIDPNRIMQARNKYNFGADMSAWRDKVAEKIAEHTGINKSEQESSSDKKAPRIEPSLDGPDPLLDDLRATSPEAPETIPATTNISEEQEAQMVRDDYDDCDDYDEETLTSYDESLSDIDTEETETSISVDSAKQEQEPIKEKLPLTKDQPPKQEPVQVSLNLEDSVPMLMESVEDDVEEKNNHSETVSEEDYSAYDDGDYEDTAVAVKPKPIVPVGTRLEPVSTESERTLESHSANKPRYESKYADHAKHQVAAPQEVLVIHVKAAKNEYFYGNDLLELILDNGLRYGAMDIFHRHAGEDGEGPILFSMANMVKPGVFDLHTFEEFSTVGVSFFLGLPTESGTDMQAFDTMLATAKDIAEKLQGELKDENRSVLTKQTIEHYRERIRDFARRQQLEKNKS